MSRGFPVLLPLVGCLLVVGAFFSRCLGDEDGYTVLRDKSGQEIEARILSVSPDWKKVRIARRDGREFTLPPLDLALENQQFIRDWIERNPIMVDYRIEVSMSAKERNEMRDRNTYFKFNAENLSYLVTIRNLSRETLPATVVDYAILWQNGATIYEDDDSSELVWNSYGSPNEELVRGTVEIDPIPFNRDFSFETDPVLVETVRDDDDEIYAKDVVHGILVRLRLPAGPVLGEYSEGTALEGESWEELTGDAPLEAGSRPEPPAAAQPEAELPGASDE